MKHHLAAALTIIGIAIASSQAADAPQIAAAPSATKKLVNGNFAESEQDGFPKGWLYISRGWIDPRLSPAEIAPANVNFKTVQEAGGAFVRATYNKATGHLGQLVAVPKGAKHVEFKCFVRGPIAGSEGDIQLRFRFFGTGHQDLLHADGFTAHAGKTSPKAWRAVEAKGQLPIGTEVVLVSITSAQTPLDATYEYQRAEVKFR